MIKIAHLYYDLMNLYGDNGNIKALKEALESQGIKAEIKQLSIDDNIDFNDFDVIYIGPGTYNNEKIVLRHLLKNKDKIKEAFDNNKFFLITGNALELFGKCIIDGYTILEGLGLIDFVATKRSSNLVSEVYARCDFLDNYLVLGFKNQDSTIEFKELTVFDIIKGYGINEITLGEGILIKNFFGTYMLGPILVRNPELLMYFTKKIIDSKYDNFEYKPFDLGIQIKAHDEYEKNYFDPNWE